MPRKRVPVDTREIEFNPLPFRPMAWERERIHRYAVRSPRWWHQWKRLRTWLALRGIG